MFEDRINRYRNIVNAKIEDVLSQFSNKNCKFVPSAIRYSLLGGGKLLRPVLTLAVCEMFGGDVQKAVFFACAVEFIHVGSLIHDDLPCMDDDSIRRGRPCCHIKFNEAVAVLAGDSLFCGAFEILTYSKRNGLSDKEIVEAVEVLSRMFGVCGVIGGQDMDIFSVNSMQSEVLIKNVATYKTCSLIRAACILGAIAAKADKSNIDVIDEYANFLGLAFQICDDILDFKKEKDSINFLSVYSVKEAKEKAKKYTNLAVNRLKTLSGSEFLIELTNKLLVRER